MPERPYFDQSGEPSDAPARFVRVDDLDPLIVSPRPGVPARDHRHRDDELRLIRAGPPAPAHHHAEQQIAIILSGELTLTVADETKVMHAGSASYIPPKRQTRRRRRPRRLQGRWTSSRLHVPPSWSLMAE
jgi:mannose-6-phosphate isomerase-like protein (cupin superfamily)